jgi:AcrR family transcriptional regulator
MSESIVKDKILDVASRLFFEQGYNLTGINQIIEEAGIARGSLYNHFASKTDLLLAYLEKAQQERLSEMAAYIKPIGDPKKKLVGLFDYRIQRQQRIGYRGCQFIKICAEVENEDTAVFELVEKHKDQVKDFIREIVRDTARRGDQQQMLPDELFTDMVFFLLEGSTTSVGFSRNVQSLKSARKIVEKML